jgi:hypothetical protein
MVLVVAVFALLALPLSLALLSLALFALLALGRPLLLGLRLLGLRLGLRPLSLARARPLARGR